jgi:hypothetical protein
MVQRSHIAVALACLVFSYSSFATSLECGQHREARGADIDAPGSSPGLHQTRDGHGPHANHVGHDHAHGAPTSHGATHSRGAACCHATLYSVVFQSVSPIEALRADGFTLLPVGLGCTTTAAVALASRAMHLATGPPEPWGSSISLFPARAVFLALSSFLV